MLEKGATLYFGIVGEAGHVHRREASVLGFEEGAYRVELRDAGEALWPGLVGRAFFRIDRGFVSQEARVEAVLRDEPKPVVALVLSGPVESAEMRECYRVPANQEIIRVVANRESCAVLDVSPIGLGVMAEARWSVGDEVALQLVYGDLRLEGHCSVQSVQFARGKQVRYGLACLENAQGGSLRTGLARVCAQIQTEQMRRRPRKKPGAPRRD